MPRYSISIRLVLLVFAACAIAIPCFAGQTIAYPTRDHVLFTISAPDDWELSQAEEEGAFFNLNSPTGATVSFRSLPGQEDDMKHAIDETIDFVSETYDNAEFGEPVETELDGQPAFQIAGSGVNRHSGKAVKFLMAWTAMKNGNIAEIWAAVYPNDEAGTAQANAIMNSFRSH